MTMRPLGIEIPRQRQLLEVSADTFRILLEQLRPGTPQYNQLRFGIGRLTEAISLIKAAEGKAP